MKMATKLMWVFVLMAMVPTASLTAVYAYYASQLADGISTLHYVGIEEAETRRQAHDHLVAIEQGTSQFIQSRTYAQRAGIESDIRAHESSFIAIIDSYQNEEHERYENMLMKAAADANEEKAIISSIREDWRDYGLYLEGIFAAQGREDFVPMATAIAAESEPLLDSMHKQIDDLASHSTKTSAALVEKSQNDYAMSQLFGTLASGMAAAAALFVSVWISKKYHLSFEERKRPTRA